MDFLHPTELLSEALGIKLGLTVDFHSALSEKLLGCLQALLIFLWVLDFKSTNNSPAQIIILQR